MNSPPIYSYDKDVDVLYIAFSPGEKATTAVELNDNILLRFNRAEKRAVGLTLMDFSVLIQLTRLGPRSFPLSGLQELEADWQDTVIDIITSPPVNQILKVSTYTPRSQKPYLTRTRPLRLQAGTKKTTAATPKILAQKTGISGVRHHYFCGKAISGVGGLKVSGGSAPHTSRLSPLKNASTVA